MRFGYAFSSAVTGYADFAFEDCFGRKTAGFKKPRSKQPNVETLAFAVEGFTYT